MTYDTWKTTNPDDEWLGPEPYAEALGDCPCDFDSDGNCMHCGASDYIDECFWETGRA